MEIYLIRHTTPKIDKGICYGQSNIDVDDNFIKEVTEIKKQLALKENAIVYSSSLLRCYKLAKELSNIVFLDSNLKEMHFGTWENKAWDAIPEKEIAPWMANFVVEKPPKGESYIELQKRILSFFKKIKNRTNSTPIIIVSHAGPIRAFLASILPLPLEESFTISINYGQVIKLSYEEKEFKIIYGLETTNPKTK